MVTFKLIALRLLSVKLNLGLTVFFSIFSFFLVMFSLSVSLLESVKLTLAMVLQIIPGFYVWTRINKGKVIPLSELVGMGFAIGSLLSIISAAILRTFPLGGFGWTAPFFLTISVWCFSKIFKNSTGRLVKNISRASGMRIYTFVIAIVIYLQVFVWSSWNSLKPEGWWKYNLDVPYLEAFSNSIALLGTTGSLMKPDLVTRYHWFAYGWIGPLNNSLKIDPFVVQTRLLPLVAMIMAATVAFSWAKDFTDNTWVAAAGSFLIVLGPGFAIGSLVIMRSPSSAMAAGWTLAFSLHFFRCLRSSKVDVQTLLTLGLLSIGVVAGKGVNFLIIGSSVFALLLNHLRLKRTLGKKDLQIYLVVFAFLVLTYFYLIHTPNGRDLKLGIFFGWPAIILTVLPLTLAIFTKSSVKNEEHQHLKVYATVAILCGGFLSLVTRDSNGDQIYFLISAITLCIVPNMILIEKIIQNDSTGSSKSIESLLRRTVKAKRLTVLLSASGFLASGTWIYFENQLGIIGDIGRAAAPVILWILAILGTFTLFWRENLRIQKLTLLFTILILGVSATSSSIGVLASLVRGPIYAENPGYVGYGQSDQASPGSISSNYFEAGDWVKKNTDLTEKFFTNRQCIDPKSRYENCLDIWFFASALSKRQYLIEGGGYNISDSDYKIKMNEDQRVSLRFSLSPNLDDLDYLWHKGVRWGWIDKSVIDRTDWRSFAIVEYENEAISIIHLVNSKIFKKISD